MALRFILHQGQNTQQHVCLHTCCCVLVTRLYMRIKVGRNYKDFSS